MEVKILQSSSRRRGTPSPFLWNFPGSQWVAILTLMYIDAFVTWTFAFQWQVLNTIEFRQGSPSCDLQLGKPLPVDLIIKTSFRWCGSAKGYDELHQNPPKMLYEIVPHLADWLVSGTTRGNFLAKVTRATFHLTLCRWFAKLVNMQPLIKTLLLTSWDYRVGSSRNHDPPFDCTHAIRQTLLSRSFYVGLRIIHRDYNWDPSSESSWFDRGPSIIGGLISVSYTRV